jgi:hypothetical protein
VNVCFAKPNKAAAISQILRRVGGMTGVHNSQEHKTLYTTILE